MLRVLDLFTEEKPIWSVDEICINLDYTRSTGYRYTKELADAGLLSQIGKRKYSLGSRIIQWDRQLRLSDPLVKLSKEIESIPYELQGKQAWLICRLFKDQVVCVYHFGNLEASLSYSRGIPRPLFNGATSKAILAFLSNSQHMRLFVEYQSEIVKSSLGNNWKEFRNNLQKIRDVGYALSISEVDKEVFGLAAPILSQDGKIQASISCVRSINDYDPDGIEAEVVVLKKYAAKLGQGLA